MENKKSEGIILSLIASFCGACVPIFSKLILEYLTPSFALFSRMVTSIILITIVIFTIKKTKLVFTKQTIMIALFGSLNFVFFMLAIKFIPAHISPIFYSLVPVEATIFLFAIFREKISLLKIVGIVVGYLGAVVVILPSLGKHSDQKIELIGVIFILLASSSVAMYSVLVQKIGHQFSPYNLSFQSILLSLIFSIPLVLFSNGIQTEKNFNSIVFIYLVGIALIGTIGQYVVFQKSIALIHSSANVIFFYFQPLFVLIMSIAFLNESVKPTYFLGLIFVIIGSSLNLFTKAKKKQDHNVSINEDISSL
ncbi:MAG: DMT family transporter [Acidimicrobiia bacterium]